MSVVEVEDPSSLWIKAPPGLFSGGHVVAEVIVDPCSLNGLCLWWEVRSVFDYFQDLSPDPPDVGVLWGGKC